MEEKMDNKTDGTPEISGLESKLDKCNDSEKAEASDNTFTTISLKDMDAKHLELKNIAGHPYYRYSYGAVIKYFTLEGKEFPDEDSLKKELKLDIKSISAEEVLKPEKHGDSDESAEEQKTIDVIALMVKAVMPHIYLQDDSEYILLANYAILSYCFQLFDRIPYLSLRGTKGSGKTTVMEILNHMVRNPKFNTNVTPAALFRMIEESMPTLLIDEVEALGAKSSGNSPIIQILNSGYQKDGRVPRIIKNEIVEFGTFSPKVIAGINVLPEATEERCIKITMEKSSAQLKKFTFTPDIMKQMQEIKDEIVKGVRRNAAGIMDYLTGKEKLDINPEIINRDRDLWLPILILAKVFEYEDSKYFEKMTSLALKGIRRKKEAEALKPENQAKAILSEGIDLKKIEVVYKDKTSQYVKAKNVYELIEEKDVFNSYKSQADLTNVLKKVGIEAVRRRVDKVLTPLYKLPLQFS